MNNADELVASRAQIGFMEQLQEMLLYMVTHELRTPVMTIMGFADILHSDWQTAANVAQSQQHLERIRTAAQRQNSIIQGLQQIAYLQRQPLHREPTNISELVGEQFKPLLPAQHKPILHVTEAEPVEVDAAMVSTALHALLSILTVIAQQSANCMVAFGPTDNGYSLRLEGSGLDLGADKALPLLLRRLQSGSDFPGTGMHLLTAATIICRHGGELRISPALGHELGFHFTLPAAK